MAKQVTKNQAVHRLVDLHARIAYLAGLALRIDGCDKIALDLAEIRKDLGRVFDVLKDKDWEKNSER